MKNLFIRDLKKGDTFFDESFAVKKYKKATTRGNKPYVDLVLADSTGTMSAKIWSEELKNCVDANEGSVISIDGEVNDFQGKFQINITKLQIVKDFNEEDYIEKTNNNINDMFKEIEDTVANIGNKSIKSLLENILKDQEIQDGLKKGAGGYSVHHAYSGGLLEHTVEVLAISKVLSQRFPKVNTDLLFAGAILHDLGKIFEYRVGTTINITKEGKLLGHIFIGTEFVKNKSKEIKDFPKDLINELLHLLLSHHGEIEYGSPIKPKTIEGIMLWNADDTSAKVNMAYSSIHEGSITDEFTQYHRQLGTELYKSPYLDAGKEALF